MKQGSFWSVIGACGLAVASTSSALAQDGAVSWRLSHNLPTNNALHYGVLEPWAASIAEASEGSIKIDIFPAQQLGRAQDHYNIARDGIADVALYLVGIDKSRNHLTRQ